MLSGSRAGNRSVSLQDARAVTSKGPVIRDRAFVLSAPHSLARALITGIGELWGRDVREFLEMLLERGYLSRLEVKAFFWVGVLGSLLTAIAALIASIAPNGLV